MARVLPADDPQSVSEAAALLLRGGLVAFPTETVYGLGALALDDRAVRAIFEAKGRPSHNPVIAHVLDLDAASTLVDRIPPAAAALARAFWPGPLTLVFHKRSEVPYSLTAGGPTVAVRAPAHPAARALLTAVGQPVAAPSANRSSGVSPTSAAHVQASLGDRIPLILDGGPCPVGIESTVLDLTGPVPVLLRPGGISRGELASALGVEPASPPAAGGPLRSPGLLTRHYAPSARVELVDPEEVDAARARLEAEGLRVGVLSAGQPRGPGLALPADPGGYARDLYNALHDLDARFDALVIALPGSSPPWEAVLDRLRRAAARS